MSKLSRLAPASLAVPLLGLVELGAAVWCRARAPRAWNDVGVPAARAMREIEQPGDARRRRPALGRSRGAPRARRRADADRATRPAPTSPATRTRSRSRILGERSAELARLPRECAARASATSSSAASRTRRPRTWSTTSSTTSRPPDRRRPRHRSRRRLPLEPARRRSSRAASAATPPSRAQRFECPGGVFFNVGVTVIADEEFRPRRCLWSHPFARGEIVTPLPRRPARRA